MTAVEDRDEIVVLNDDDYLPDFEHAAGRSTQDMVEPLIDDGKPVDLVVDRVRRKKIIESFKQGKFETPTVSGGGNVFVLSRANGLLYGILLAECVLAIGLAAFVGIRVLNLPARAVPSTAQAEGYQRATTDTNTVTMFAELVCARMETWNHWNVKDIPQRVVSFLDPAIRGPYEGAHSKNIADAHRFDARQFYEPVLVQHKGIVDQTIHKVNVFYQQYQGRGSDPNSFKLDRVGRRVKFLEIVEGSVTNENRYGLYVVKHYDLSEKEFMDAIISRTPVEQRRHIENPWSASLGEKTKIPK